MYLYLIVIVLVSVAFFTLLERKILGYGHLRKGPNKVGLIGLFQPFSDAIKLFSKSNYRLEGGNFFYYCCMPVFGLLIMLYCWINYVGVGSLLNLKMNFLFLFCIIRVGVYSILAKGWFSGSVYGLLGGYRSCAQAISYEIRMVFLIIVLIIILGRIEIDKFFYIMEGTFYFNLFTIFILVAWLIICLCESNRSPFDLSEGESELVSGFNTEYRGGGFSLIFISEYGIIVFWSYFTSLLFLGGSYILPITLIRVRFMFVHVRLRYPRVRYDLLIEIAWKILLFFVIIYYFWGIFV